MKKYKKKYKKNIWWKNMDMYTIISSLSYIIRFFVCYITIEQYSIFQDKTITWILWQTISIYTILLAITYPIVWNIATQNGIKGWTEKSIIYFCIYMILVAILYFILFILTSINILPIL